MSWTYRILLALLLGLAFLLISPDEASAGKRERYTSHLVRILLPDGSIDYVCRPGYVTGQTPCTDASLMAQIKPEVAIEKQPLVRKAK